MKPQNNTRWCRLTDAQRELLDKWLFVERESYESVLERVRNEFQLADASRSSLIRYCWRRQRERQMVALAEAQAMSETLGTAGLDTNSMRAAAIKLIAKTTLQLACERPEQLKDVGYMAKVLLSSEDNDIRRGRLNLEEARLRLSSAKDIKGEIPKLARLLVAIEEDDNLTDEAKLNKVHALLFPKSANNGPMPSAKLNDNAVD